MKRKIMAIVLTLIILVTLPCNSLAVTAYPTGWNVECTEQLVEQLALVIADTANPLRNQINVDNIRIGDAIHTYEYVNGEINVLNIVIYPVFSNNKLVLLASKIVNEDRSCNIHITQALVTELVNFLNEKIALVYDAENCYIVKNSVISSVREFSYEVDYRDRLWLSVGEKINETNIIYTELASSYILNYSPTARSTINPVVLNVPVIYQYDNPICWAATVASIGKYLTGIDLDAEDVALSYVGNLNTPLNVGEAMLALLQEFGISYPLYSLSTAPTQNQIYRNVSSGYPMYGRWSFTSGSHATVIRGVASNGALYLMDPEYGYCYAYVSATGGYRYTTPYSGVELTLIGYGAKMS